MTKFSININIGFFLLAMPAFLVQAELRGTRSFEEDVTRNLRTHGFHEELGNCRGANCGMWGDPHMITCDGKAYDCQGVGTFNVMENNMYKIQGQFVDVGAREQGMIQNWGLTEGASLLNDIAIEFKQETADGTKPPVFQLGFGELDLHDKNFRHPSERDCNEYSYYRPTDMPGQRRSVESSLEDCHDRCNATEGCEKFSYWADGGCHMNNWRQHHRAAPRNWPRSLSGFVNTCGRGPPPPEELELLDPMETRFHGSIGKRCPLLFHVDGKLQDISNIYRDGYLYGNATSDVSIKMTHNFYIDVEYKLKTTGDKATARFFSKGHGPGELWSCHWDFWVCLPQSQQQDFMVNTTGLLGTPNGNKNDDFMDSEGNEVTLSWWEFRNWHKTYYEYCYNNHCTSQEDNIVVGHHGQTFEDIKCEHTEHINFLVNSSHCVLGGQDIVDRCKDMPPLMVHGCELDCCMGGCPEMEETRQEVVQVVTLSDDPDDALYDVSVLPPSACTDEEGLEKTSESVCPELDDDVVRLLSDGDGPPGDVFFGIEMDAGGDEVGRTVKFRVNNPFEESADVYVKYGKSVFGHSFMDPKCEKMPEQPSGCNERASVIEVACHDYDDVAPFALVQVYFASTGVSGTDAIDKCCDAPEYTGGEGVVMYSFEVQCACPTNNEDADEKDN